MADLAVTATFDLIGIEDLALGRGTFTRSTSTGGTQTITKVNRDTLEIWGARNVKDFGAVGDGTTDDTIAIQQALDDAAATPAGVVFFPEGTYKVTGPLYVTTDDVALVGEGRDTVKLSGGGTTDLIDHDVVIDVQKNFSMRGLWFDGFGMVVKLRNIPVSTILDYIDIQNCKFTECGAPAYWNDFTVGSGIDRINVVDNVVEDCDRGFFFGCMVIHDSYVAGNTIRNVERKGIQLGVNVTDLTLSDEPDLNHHRVIGNYVKDVHDPDGIDGIYESNAIYVYGQYAVVHGNIIENLTTADQDNCEGIYIKCRNSTITSNVLIDAGTGQGCISIKGSDYDLAGQPRGYGVICANNAIYSTGLDPDGALYYGTGIFTQNGNCLIANNYIEGLHGSAIRIETDENDFTNVADNVTIRGNVVKKTRGSYAITVEAVGDKIEICDNVIDEILDEDESTGYAAGIQILTYADSDGITRLRIKRNTIRGIVGGLELARGIWIVRSTDHTISDVVIEGNEIDDVTAYGIALSGEVAISGLRILNNRILNIDTANGDIASTGGASYAVAGMIVEGNYGDFVNENRGQATLTNGSTSVTVTHGLSNISSVGGTPLAQDFTIVPIETMGNATKFWVDTIGATTFKINVNTDPGADVDFAWRVQRRVWQQ